MSSLKAKDFIKSCSVLVVIFIQRPKITTEIEKMEQCILQFLERELQSVGLKTENITESRNPDDCS